MKTLEKETDAKKTMDLLCLIAAGIVPFLVILMGCWNSAAGFFLAEKYVAVPALLFFGSVLSRRLSPVAKRSVLLALAAVLWFIITQVQHHLNHMDTRDAGIFSVVYLLAFPYAAVTEDGNEAAGLKWIGRIYLAFSSLMVAGAVMLYMDALPEVLASGIFWDGARIRLFWHPNGSAFVLLLGMGFGLYFFTQAKKTWTKCALAMLTALHFCAIVLTNSRTTILLACALIAGTVFFTLWKGTWKQFLAGAGAALVVMAVLIFSYDTLFDFHKQMQIDKLLKQVQMLEEQQVQNEPTADAEAAAVEMIEETATPQSSGNQQVHIDEQTGEAVVTGGVDSHQGDLSQDIKHLNGRLWIWEGAVAALKENPQVRLWGTEYVDAEINYRSSLQTINAHNSWLQMGIMTGIPGLLIALAFTVIAVWNLWILIWRPHEEICRKIIAMMVICLLAGGILEVYLFTGEDISNCENFLFFLCTGYLIQWNHASALKR